MTKIKLQHFLIAGALPWILLLVTPVMMFLGNQDQYGSFTSLLATCAIAFIIGTALLLASIKLARTRIQSQQIIQGLLIGLAIAAWVQSQLLVWDLGPLDGRGLPWENFRKEGHLEIVVWLFIIGASIAFTIKTPSISKNLITAVWLLGAISLTTSFLTYDTPTLTARTSSIGEFPSTEEALSFHPKNNTIVIILDSYQSDAFLETLQKYTEETEFLDGFTYYPNTVGGYPTTRHSVPMILTGKMYRNDFPYDDTHREEFEKPSLISYYQARNYGVIGDVHRPTFSSFDRTVMFPPSVRAKTSRITNSENLRALDIGIFRASPLFLKKFIYDENRWFLSKLGANSTEPPSPHGEDWRFVQTFVDTARVSSDFDGEFKFIHLMGAHHPLSVDENFRYVPNLVDSRENYVNQTRGALSLARKMLEKLKDLGIYTHAEIIITADHGAHNRIPMDLVADEQTLDVPIFDIGGARPLLLHKKSGASGHLETSDKAMHLSYVPCILGGIEDFDCDDFSAAISGETVTRPYYRYEWSQDFWFQDYSPPMTRLEVRGDVRKGESWSHSDIVFENGSSHKTDRSYQIGDFIDFGQTGSSAKYLLNGWSVQEAKHRWTNGSRAVILLGIAEGLDRDVILELDARGMSPDGHRPQPVSVLANNTVIANWEVLGRDKYNAVIPADLERQGQLRIVFDIKEPRSPIEISGVSDHRKLGLAAFGLNLQFAD